MFARERFLKAERDPTSFTSSRRLLAVINVMRLNNGTTKFRLLNVQKVDHSWMSFERLTDNLTKMERQSEMILTDLLKLGYVGFEEEFFSCVWLFRADIPSNFTVFVRRLGISGMWRASHVVEVFDGE